MRLRLRLRLFHRLWILRLRFRLQLRSRLWNWKCPVNDTLRFGYCRRAVAVAATVGKKTVDDNTEQAQGA